jgi:GT2 family glycosyltransferase
LNEKAQPEMTRYADSEWAGASQCMSAASFWTPKWAPSASFWLEHAPFGFWLIDALRPGLVVELGTNDGYSFAVFCQGVHALSLDCHCYGVAPSGVRTRLSDHIESHYGSFASLIHSDLDQAQAHFADGSINLLYIDGCDSYKAALVNFMSWRSKLARSAIVLFHGTNVGVAQLWQELKRDHKHFELDHGLGLGILAAGESFPAPLEYLFRSAREPQVASQIRLAYSQLGSSISSRTRRFDPEVQFRQSETQHSKASLRLAEILKVSCRLAEIESELTSQLMRVAYLTAHISVQKAAVTNDNEVIKNSERDSQLAVPSTRKIEIQEEVYEVESFQDQQDFAEAICWYDAISPEVSIIIVNFNKAGLTRDCLRHVWAHTRNRRYEIIVVDNGSSSAELQKLTEFSGNFCLVRLPVNRFFGEGCNIGVEASRGRYIVFLNNDAIVTDNWLEPLITLLERRPDSGGVGPKFLYPDGRIQEAGVFLDERGIAIQRGKEYTIDEETMGPVDYCSAACFATLRAIFDRVSGFDPSFEPGFYEDADLCFKIRSLGLFTYYCPQSVIHHIEHATVSSFRRQFERAKEINRETFLDRWGGYLLARACGEREPSPPVISFPSRPAICNARVGDPVAVFYTSYDLVPDKQQRYLLTAASALQKSHRLYLGTDARYSAYRLHHLAHDLSLDPSQISIITRPELGNLGSIDLFVHIGDSSFPSVAAMGRRNFYVCQDPFPLNNQHDPNLRENLSGYDCVFVESAFAQHHLRKTFKTLQVDLEPKILAPPVQDVFRVDKEAARSIILSIGKFTPSVNGRARSQRYDIVIEGIRRLVEAGVDAELHVLEPLHLRPRDMNHHVRVEDVTDCKMLSLSYSALAERLPICFHMNAVPELVRDLLSRAKIYWDTIGFDIDPLVEPEGCEAAGTAILEAMAAGCVPFVPPNGAPVEFVREAESGFQYTTVQELVSKTKDILQDSARIAAISQRAMHEARSYARLEEFAAKWRSIAKS